MQIHLHVHCSYTCTHTHTHVCVCARVCACARCVCTRVRAGACVCTRVCACALVRVHARARWCVCAYARVRWCVCSSTVYVSQCTHTYARTYRMYEHNTHTHLHAYMHSSIAYIHVNPSSTYVYIYIYTQDLYAYTERNTEGTFTSASASGPTTVSTTFAPDEAPHPMVLSAHGGSPTAPAPGLPDSARQKTSSTEGGELTVTIELSTSRTAPSNSIRTSRNTPCRTGLSRLGVGLPRGIEQPHKQHTTTATSTARARERAQERTALAREQRAAATHPQDGRWHGACAVELSSGGICKFCFANKNFESFWYCRHTSAQALQANQISGSLRENLKPPTPHNDGQHCF